MNGIGSVIIQMKQAITNLSKQQNAQLHKIIAHHNLDPRTSTKAQKYYRELRKIYTHLHSENYQVEHLMKTAIIIAEKSHALYNVKGERLRGLALSINEMIKLNEPIIKLANIARVFANHSKSVEPELREELLDMVEELRYGCSMYGKFERAIEYFGLQQVGEAREGYKSAFKSFTWLFFLQAGQQLSIKSQADSDYLLISILYLTVRYAFPYIRPKEIASLHVGFNQKHLVTSIFNKLFQIFIIDDTTRFKRINSRVDDYFESLICNEGLKCTNSQSNDFLSPHQINLNYRKIDLLYRKYRDPNSIDCRLFLNNRLQTLTPRRFSQISEQKTKDRRNFKQKSFASHKILTFENEGHYGKRDQGERLQQIKLPANVKLSPSNTKTPMIWAVHHSPSSPIQNYVCRQVRQGKAHLGPFEVEEDIVECIREILSSYCSDELVVKDKTKITYNYYIILRKRFVGEKGSQQNELECAVLTYALLIMVTSISKLQADYQRVRCMLSFIGESVSLQVFDLWVINSKFMQSRTRLPSQLQELIVLMDDLIIHELIWQKQNSIHSLTLAYQHKGPNPKVIRVLHAVIDKLQSIVVRLVTEFTTLENGQEIEKMVDKTIKFIVLKTPQLIQSHNLIQIVCCCVYVVFRTSQIGIKFNEILGTMQKIMRMDNSTYRRLINEVEIEVQQGVIVCNIIEYYNRLFLPFIKQHRQSMHLWYVQSLSQEIPSQKFTSRLQETSWQNDGEV